MHLVESLKPELIFNERKSKYNLRGERALNIPSVNTTKYGLHSIRYLGSKLWNSVSNDLHKLNLKEFTLAIQKFNFLILLLLLL